MDSSSLLFFFERGRYNYIFNKYFYKFLKTENGKCFGVWLDFGAK